MSKNVNVNRTAEQRVSNHERRLLAIERALSAQAAAGGIPDLRDVLYQQADTPRTNSEACRNVDPGLAGTSATFASGATKWCALYWPGGVTTSLTFILATVGVYTDASPNSGVALYSYDGTTLTRQATKPQKFDSSFTTGLHVIGWTSAIYLDAGVYYAALRYFASSATTAPQFGAVSAADSSVWGGDAAQAATPTGWPLMFSSSGASGQLPATQAASGLTPGGGAAMPYLGLS